MDKFVPKEPGYYWIFSAKPNTRANHIVYYDDFRRTVLLCGEEYARPADWVWDNDLAFHEGPIQPPEEGRG